MLRFIRNKLVDWLFPYSETEDALYREINHIKCLYDELDESLESLKHRMFVVEGCQNSHHVFIKNALKTMKRLENIDSDVTDLSNQVSTHARNVQHAINRANENIQAVKALHGTDIEINLIGGGKLHTVRGKINIKQ